jgi:hypothetical protein
MADQPHEFTMSYQICTLSSFAPDKTLTTADTEKTMKDKRRTTNLLFSSGVHPYYLMLSYLCASVSLWLTFLSESTTLFRVC